MPPELDATRLRKDFNASHPDKTDIGYQTYRRTLKDLRISFAKMGKECSSCAKLDGERLGSLVLQAEQLGAHYRRDMAGDELVYSIYRQRIIILPW